MISEAGHYTTFLGFARKYADNVDVDKRWKEWITFETSILPNYGKTKLFMDNPYRQQLILIKKGCNFATFFY
jgi:tRNA isopentenyl-2-thiomethyl-A-37 hydroxylase MiaE